MALYRKYPSVINPACGRQRSHTPSNPRVGLPNRILLHFLDSGTGSYQSRQQRSSNSHSLIPPEVPKSPRLGETVVDIKDQGSTNLTAIRHQFPVRSALDIQESSWPYTASIPQQQSFSRLEPAFHPATITTHRGNEPIRHHVAPSVHSEPGLPGRPGRV